MDFSTLLQFPDISRISRSVETHIIIDPWNSQFVKY